VRPRTGGGPPPGGPPSRVGAQRRACLGPAATVGLRPTRCGGSHDGQEAAGSDEAQPRLARGRVPSGGRRPGGPRFSWRGDGCGNPRNPSRPEGPLRGPRFLRRPRKRAEQKDGGGTDGETKRLRRPQGRRWCAAPLIPASDSEQEMKGGLGGFPQAATPPKDRPR